MRPTEVISETQQTLMHCAMDVEVALDIVATARTQLLQYFDRHPISNVDPQIEDGHAKRRWEVERVVTGVVQGVLARNAIFCSLERVESDDYTPPTREVDYVTSLVDPYPDWDGEHQFMTALVAELDEGVFQSYQDERTSMLRLLFREVSAANVAAMDELGEYEWAIRERRPSDSFDPWTADPSTLFAVDVHDVRDRLRHTLRHNAETAMTFVRLFPIAIHHALSSSGRHHPLLTFAKLQQLFLDALPTLSIAASLRMRRPPPADPRHRQHHEPPPDLLRCELGSDGIFDFRWAPKNMAGPQKQGRCPANASLPGLDSRQQRMIRRVRDADESPMMSTAEALLRVAAFVAPTMWRFQYEADDLCTGSE